ncbi:unnamed protein product (macronuclear) [Paramecium tetraurelia]|uniref:EGF-like domain-containing protein n=1 Tax=Paramecium tetraurelia TaxID=5888 RepID=A0DKY1_PARTE|nr:uncharacterized protein GSPATT00018015001 [Paramecium tetraurelia]CAK83698.1 unnamed protein product [Paramecium tetraurelia]|eukprot:XP_001451095.1 hypothetical protein (macronuclear) [Paramecium tetraurelia strain d4-2]
MLFQIFTFLFSQFVLLNSQWTTYTSMLYYDSQFTQNTGDLAWYNSGGFLLPSSQTTANFISCSTPSTSYITLNNIYPSAETYNVYSFQGENWISMDLYFQSTWSSQKVEITLGSFSFIYTYTSPTTYPLTGGFCDNSSYEVKTLNFTYGVTGTTSQEKLKIKSYNTNSGQVSFKNVYISNIICYPSCRLCAGPNYNQCTSCYYGSTTNSICPPCQQNQFYWKHSGCYNICKFDNPLLKNGFCQEYPIQVIEQGYYDSNSIQALRWQIIYDPQHLETNYTKNAYAYGVFRFNSGVNRYMNNLPNYSYSTYLVGVVISIMTYNDIPLNCGIQFKINNTYYGSIYRNASGIQTHQVKISQITNYGSYLSYAQSQMYQIIAYVDIPKYSFLFSVVGNYTVDTAGWGISGIQVTQGYCSNYCQLCEVSFKCKICQSGCFFYRDGSCTCSCSAPYQKPQDSYCYDYDDETPYSSYLIKEYISSAGDPEQYAKYTLISQSGTNFLKGSNIYFSFYNQLRLFGGPLVWAQAKFQRVHTISSPHHSLTIAFYILYGPSFSEDGQFIYTIENNAPVTKSTQFFFSTYFDSKYDKVYEKINHNTNTLTITWECFGPNNEPIQAFCGVYNYYIAVHNCQPYCLECEDQSKCTQWNSTYDSNIVKFSQAECLINQYHDKETVRCLECPQSCLTCTSKLDCQTCKSTYTQSKLGCTCKMNQYEESNQCFDCPIECNQCLTSTQCIECLISNNRKLSNGQCNCIDGYYHIVSNPQCKLCHQFCKTCTGPTASECLTCNNIVNIEYVGSTCRCPAGYSYKDATKTCDSCHPQCQTCFRTKIDGCLTCDPASNRILKGLNCVCKPGYYENNTNCTSCPTIETPSLSQCYKICINNQLIWHTATCSSCDTGFQLVSGQCQPICGDLQKKGYEQCEDNNAILNDLCFNCQFQCPAHCLTCDQSITLPCPDICGDEIITGIEECEDGNNIQYDGCFNCKYQCQPQCTNCIKGQCFECSTAGWRVDTTVTPWQCNHICGDTITVGSEQCDDGNSSDTDGCKNCMYFCRLGCSSCDYSTNKCLSCSTPGFAPYSYYCQNICGDGIVAIDPTGFFTEQCDDGNTTNYDGCSSSCEFQCQNSSICTNCVSSRCETCAVGYVLSSQKICIPICGDSLIVAFEQCEKSFILPYKGCQNCLAKCQNSCLTCDNSGLGCLACKTGYNRIDYLCYSKCGDGIITQDEECDDDNLVIGDGCHFCKYSCQDSCLFCLKGICQDCQEGYQLVKSKCYSICGSGFQQYNKQCDVVTSLQTYQNCQSCKFTCDSNCLSCQFGICQQCKDGYELVSNKWLCVKSIQYNSIVVEYCKIQIGDSCDQCEDYAYFEKGEQKCRLKAAPLSFCQYQLRLSPDLYCSYCFDYCESCNENNCLICQKGYYLDENYSCVSICGDGIIVQEEECDYGSEYQIDTCLNCSFQCPQYCMSCVYGVCYHCLVGFYLNNLSNQCTSVCGDKILAIDEACDYDNYEGYVDCAQCQFKCQDECLDCQLGKCMLCELPLILSKSKCEEIKQCEGLVGLYYDNDSNDCLPQCGDEIVAGNEDCEDFNSLPGDGCYECKFQCSKDCQVCQDRVCIQCITDYYLNNYQCLLDKANDNLNSSIIEEPKDNDPDPNIIIETQNNGTSTDSTKLEQSLWKDNKICRGDECVYSKKAIMQLTYIKQLYALQYVDITFDQEVKIQDNIIKDQMLFNISIKDLDSKYYNITINPIQYISFDLQYAQYQVQIEILQQLSINPVLLIELNQKFVNSNNQTILNPNESIVLQLPKIMSESSKQISNLASSSNKAFMIGAITICGVSLISSQSSFVIETLNLLQYQSFLRFINVDYPENLQIYFQAQEMLSITSYIQYFQADDYLNIITRKEKQVNLSGKFQQYNVEADLFTNFLPQFIQILALLPLLYFARSLFLLFFKLGQYMKCLEYQTTYESKILMAIINLLLNFQNHVNQLTKLRYLQNYNKILQPIYVNSWDLIFKVILQLNYNRVDNLRSILTTIFATSIFLMCICLLLKSFSICSKLKDQNTKVNQQVKFIALDISRTMFFHIVLIKFQSQQILQWLLISFSNLSQFYLIYQYKICTKFDRIILLTIEGVLTVFSLSLFVYFDFGLFSISYENQVTLGFIQMNFLIMCLGIVFAKQLYPKVKLILSMICKHGEVQAEIKADINADVQAEVNAEIKAKVKAVTSNKVPS